MMSDSDDDDGMGSDNNYDGSALDAQSPGAVHTDAARSKINSKSSSPSCHVLERIAYLRNAVSARSAAIPVGTSRDIIAYFGCDGASLVPMDDDDPSTDWEVILNPGLDTILQGRSTAEITKILRTGKHGVDGLCDVLDYFIRERGLTQLAGCEIRLD